MAQHYLRPEEIEQVLQQLTKAQTNSVLPEDQLSEIIKAAKQMIPSNKEGKGLELEVAQSLKMLMQIVADPQFQEKYSKEFLTDFCEKLFKCIRECGNSVDKKNLPVNALKMVLDTMKMLKNNPELEKKLGKDFLPNLTTLALKFIEDPDSLSKAEMNELNSGLDLVFKELKPQLSKKLNASDQEDKSERVKRMAVYDDAGNIINLLDVFVPGSKAGLTLSGIVVSGARDSLEEALEGMGAIIHPSLADKAYKGPGFV